MSQKQENFTLMGGRVIMRRGRYNPTSDAVWLAACVGNVKARTVLDVGIGTGGAALCLGVHMPDAAIVGLDICDEMLAECAANAELNGRDINLIRGDIMTWRTSQTFDLVITNPPYFKGTPARHNAHHNADIAQWARRAGARVRPRGYMGIIVDAGVVSDVIAAIAGNFGDINIFPLFGGGQTAERVIIRARAGTHGKTVIHAPISMNEGAILRDGLTIDHILARIATRHD